jgi:hypothetical protein
LSLRRAIFEKFGAAELAWLGMQFFVGPKERRARGKQTNPLRGGAARCRRRDAVFFMQNRASQPVEKQLKKPPVQTVKQRGKKTTKPPESQVPAEPLHEKPFVIATHARHEKSAGDSVAGVGKPCRRFSRFGASFLYE